MAIDLGLATIVAIFVESLLFGGFTVLFGGTLYYLFGKRKVPNNGIISTVLIVMYLLALAHLIVDLQRVCKAFINNPLGADTFLANVAATTYVAKQGLFDFQTMMGDSFMIYRVYMVYSQNRFILVFGAIWMIGNMFLAIYGLVSLSHLSNATPIFVITIKRMGVGFYAITLAVNTLCTSLIASKIWLIERQMAGVYRTRSLSPAMVAIIESAALYCAALIALIGTYASNNWGHYIVFDAIPQLVGIVFTLIIVRIALGVSHTTTTVGTYTWNTRRGNTASAGSAPIKVKMSTFRQARNDMNETIDMTTTDTLASRGEDIEKGENQLKYDGGDSGSHVKIDENVV